MAIPFIRPLTLALLTTAALPAAQAVALVNGGLESPIDGKYQNIPAGTNANDWAVSGNNIEFVRLGYTSSGDTIGSVHEGEWFVDLNGTQGAGAISQAVATEAGQDYRISFWMSGNPGPLGVTLLDGSKSLDVLWNGDVVGAFSYQHLAGDNWGNLRWEAHDLTVTGSGALDTLQFRSTSTRYPAAGAFVDGIGIIEVSAVPEPATSAMLGLGVALLFVARRRLAASSASAM